MPGFDKVHVRWYCKFDANFDQGNLMHLNKLIAGIGHWSGYGAAGRRPSGFDFFRTSLDSWRDWGRNPPPGEMMLKANMAGMNNGEQAFWINGKLVGHFKNITWRYTNDLKINSFSLGPYIHDNKKVNRVWFDDVVVSAGYIGL